MVVLDSAFLIDLERRRPDALKLMEALQAEAAPLRVPAQAAVELLTGNEAAATGLSKLHEAFDIVPTRDQEILEAARIARRAQQSGTRISWSDISVAAVASLVGEPVVTADPSPFRAAGCEVRTYRTR